MNHNSTQISLEPCLTEASQDCYWDATTHGNGEGRSFVDIGGIAYYAGTDCQDAQTAYSDALSAEYVVVSQEFQNGSAYDGVEHAERLNGLETLYYAARKACQP